MFSNLKNCKNVRSAVGIRLVSMSFISVLVLLFLGGCHNSAFENKKPESRHVSNVQVYPSVSGAVLKWDTLESSEKVSGYLVEYRELGSHQWKSVNEKNGFSSNINSLKKTVSMKATLSLVPKKEYEFLVKAISSNGEVLAQSVTGHLAEQETYDINGDGHLSKTNMLRYPDPSTLGVGPVTDISIVSIKMGSIKLRWRKPELNNNQIKNYEIEYIDGLNDLNGDGFVNEKDYSLFLKSNKKTLKKILTVSSSNEISSAVLGSEQGFNPLSGNVYVFRVVSQYTRGSENLISEQGVPYFFRPGISSDASKSSYNSLELKAYVAASQNKPVVLSNNEIYLTWFNAYERALKYYVEYKKVGEKTDSHIFVEGSSNSLIIRNLEEGSSYYIRLVGISGSTDTRSMLYTENVAELSEVSLTNDVDKTSQKFVLSYTDISANQYGANAVSSPIITKSENSNTEQYRYAITSGALHGLSIDAKTGVLKLNTLMALPVKNHRVEVKTFPEGNPSSSDAVTGTLDISLQKHSTYSTDSITATNYVQLLGVGLDVDWAKVSKGKDYYERKITQDFKEFGLNHVRIRVRDRVTGPDENHEEYTMTLEERLFEYVSTMTRNETGLDQQLKDTLSLGLTPVLAYQGSEFEEDPQNEKGGMDRVVEWWKIASERYQNLPAALSFNLIIEVTDGLKNEVVALNKFYDTAIKEIRKTNSKRVLFMGPTKISNPYELEKLTLPTPKEDAYIAAEWHFFAAGPYGSGRRYPNDYTDIAKRGKFVDNFWDYEKNKYASPFRRKSWTSYGKAVYDIENPTVVNGEPVPKTVDGKIVLMTNEFGGTVYQRKLVTDSIATAVQWSKKTGIPTWVGAWMTGNFNQTHDRTSEFTIREQIAFGKFISSKLKEEGIPFAVNSDTKFYDRINKRWILDGGNENKNNNNKNIRERTSSSILNAIINPYKPTDVPGETTPVSGIPNPSSDD